MRRTRSLLLMGVLVWGALTAAPAAAAPAAPIPLWPGAAPGDTAALPAEGDVTRPTDNQPAGRRVVRLGNVSQPTLTLYPAPPEKASGGAVLVAPGGGYNILAWDLEGTEVCEWLNSLGVHAVLLKYRVPRRPERAPHAAPLQDAQRAMGLIRKNAAAWGIDPERLGVLGFSAGGHLAATLCNNTEQRSYPRVDDADDQNCRPSFAVLVYPAYLTQKDQGDRLAPEVTVTAKTPPTFLVQTQDDSVRVESSLYYYLALKQAGVPAELHLYPRGGHGYGLRPGPNPVSRWPQRAEEWMAASGWLKKK